MTKPLISNEKGKYNPDVVYYNDMGRFKRISREEEIELAAKIQATGDIEARNALVEANLRLAVHEAKKFIGQGINLEDLEQCANEGLISAANRFEPDMNAAFSTYATFWMRQRMFKFIQDNRDTMRVPRNVDDMLRGYNRIYTQLIINNERVTFESVTEEMNMTGNQKDRLRDGQKARKAAISIHLRENENGSENDLYIPDPANVSPLEGLIHKEEEEHVREAIKRLDKDSENVLTLRAGIEENKCNYKEIEEKTGFNEHKIGNLLSYARKRLHKFIKN